MSLKSYALGGAAAVAIAMLSPAQAFTFHPATPAEIRQTDDLNAQALSNARGQNSNMGTTTDASFSGGTNTNTNATMPRTPSDSSAPSNKTRTKAKMDQQPGAKPAQTDDNSVTPAPTNGQ